MRVAPVRVPPGWQALLRVRSIPPFPSPLPLSHSPLPFPSSVPLPRVSRHLLTLASFLVHSGRNAAGEPLSLGQYYLAGAGAGIGNSFVSGPVEHVRIRLQTQTSNIYSGPVDAVKKIYRADGLRGVYHGQGATLAR